MSIGVPIVPFWNSGGEENLKMLFYEFRQFGSHNMKIEFKMYIKHIFVEFCE